jgi:hypothetical protein
MKPQRADLQKRTRILDLELRRAPPYLKIISPIFSGVLLTDEVAYVFNEVIRASITSIALRGRDNRRYPRIFSCARLISC